MPLLRKRNITRFLIILAIPVVLRLLLSSSFFKLSDPREILENNVLDIVTRSDNKLDARKHKFLQVRMGRESRPDILDDVIMNGALDYWERYQKPYITDSDTSHMDVQSVLTAIEQLLSLNGWVAALCPTLTRPFGQNKHEDAYDDLVRQDNLYYFAIVIHSADHFLVDQLAVIVQMARRLGTSNIFVSMLDYDSSDSTETLVDLCEAVMTLLGVPFRIRKVPGMTADPAAAYYPLEEAHMRNLVLEPLKELYQKRKIKFNRVIWLKGFTCPNDIFETLKVSMVNEAAMVCGMDWAEHGGSFFFSDRWRTRDINGDQFRQSKSKSKPDAVPPRDKTGAARYSQYLPFQVFCCESGTHVVDPAQSYYEGVMYRAGTDFHNISSADAMPNRPPDASCLDSSQTWFCRDLWIHQAKAGVREVDAPDAVPARKKRDLIEPVVAARVEPPILPRAEPLIYRRAEPAIPHDEPLKKDEGRRDNKEDADANVGSDYDAMPDSDENLGDAPTVRLSIPNSVFRPARILVNPRCVTTYAGVSHTQLAMDLFGPERDQEDVPQSTRAGKYVLEDWEGAPESFVCQEQKSTGGRKATKTQRRLGFSIYEEVERLP